tara:strand:- start:465 stop:656 length:192 start_codon:yes stop_codon:yes gene_type:complete
MEQSKKTEKPSISPGEKNNALLKYISTDIISIKRDVDEIKSDLTIIKEYIEKKKEIEKNKWFY